MFTLPNILKFGPYLIIAILGGLLFIQTERLETKGTQLDTVQSAFADTRATLDEYVKGVRDRDEIIETQNASILAIKATSDANRDAYRAELSKAAALSGAYQRSADELLKLQSPDGELAQCRAARDLLEKELVE